MFVLFQFPTWTPATSFWVSIWTSGKSSRLSQIEALWPRFTWLWLILLWLVFASVSDIFSLVHRTINREYTLQAFSMYSCWLEAKKSPKQVKKRKTAGSSCSLARIPRAWSFFCCVKVVPKDYFLNWSFKRNENLSLIKNIFPRPLLLSNPHLIHQTHGVVGSGGKKLRKCYLIHIPHVPIHICLTWNLWNLGYLANLGDEKPMRQLDLISYIFSNHVKLFTWEDHKCQRR